MVSEHSPRTWSRERHRSRYASAEVGDGDAGVADDEIECQAGD